MPKVNNTSIYNLDSSVTFNDFLFGTDFETSNKKNKNFSLKSIYELFKNTDNNDANISSFYTFSQSISYLNESAVFNSDSTIFSDITVLNIGTKNKLIFEFLKEYKTSFLINIAEVGNPNVINFFEINNIIDIGVNGELKGIDVGVSLYKNMELGSLTDSKTYSIGIVLKIEIIAPSFMVSLPEGKTLGKYNSGDTVPEFNTVQEQLRDIGQEVIPPTFTNPTVSIISTPENTVFNEVGTTLNITLFSLFTKNDAGNLEYKKYQKSGIDLSGNLDTIILTTRDVFYNSVAYFQSGEGFKSDLLGNQYENPIQAGNVSSSVIGFKGFKAIFFGTVSSKPTTSSEVRLLNKRLENSGKIFELNTGTINTLFSFWLPDEILLISVIDLDALNAVITSAYISENFSVEDANGSEINGTLYTMTQGVSYDSNHRHQIKIS